MDIGLMLSGQDGLTWERWRHILALSERLDIASCYLTDHYFIRLQKQSLEPFLAFVLAATETRRIRFGSLVSPVTFRRPVEVGRMAAQIDQLSGNRFVLGLGAGWTASEHTAYGLSFPPIAERFDRLDEAVQLIRRLWQPGPATFDGQYFQLHGADCQPKPAPGRPPILIGGNGQRRTLPLVAERADEWNALNLTPQQYAAKLELLHRHCDALDRDPAQIRRSMTIYGLIGPTPQIVDAVTRSQLLTFDDTPPDDLDHYRRQPVPTASSPAHTTRSSITSAASPTSDCTRSSSATSSSMKMPCPSTSPRRSPQPSPTSNRPPLHRRHRCPPY